ncbi:MAG: hypothetical protein VX015_06675 [Planctomycetota bacterium]|nr:hypothetical protein [Planctomycetota bacterium]
MVNPIEPRSPDSYRSLVKDVELALLSEIGARAVFDHIARRSQDADLGRMAEGMNREGIDLVARVQELIREMGGRPRKTSFRRRALARLLVRGAPIIGPRRILRIVRDAESTVGRWYAEYALFLVRLGDEERALAFEELRAAKERRAMALSAWVDNLARARQRTF